MKILFTGASSFTGMWFVEELANAGHELICPLRSPLSTYAGLRRQRIDLLKDKCQLIFDCPFGSPSFLALISNQKKWDLLCHHAADVANYKSPDFDVLAALKNNTFNLKDVLSKLQAQGCHKVLLTGSVFEQNEGKGSDKLRAVSPYGLSKGLTTDVFHFYTSTMGLKLGKFVIPNPFGPYEEARFTTYLVQSWYDRKIPSVNTPDYVRDNIPASLLAKAYLFFANRLEGIAGFEKFNPSCYPESQGDFTARFAREMRGRLQLPCEYEIKTQIEFLEPKVRINYDALDSLHLQWNEKRAWDDLANYYQMSLGTKT